MWPLMMNAILGIIFLSLLINILLNKVQVNKKKLVLIVLSIFSLLLAPQWIDFLIWVGSNSSIYDLPKDKVILTKIALTSKPGATSSFEINCRKYEIDNERNSILEEGKEYTITYTPLTHYICKIQKIT